MSEHNETHAEAIAALRRWGRCHFARSAKVRHFCDRIDAAHKREMSKIVSKNGADFGQLGDAAAMRKAMEMMSDLFAKGMICISYENSPKEVGQIEELYRKVKAALAAPPRNCDRFASAEEAWDAYDAWVDSYRAQGKTEPYNEFGWLFAPSTEKEGGAE